MPEQHTMRVSKEYSVDSPKVWRVITDFSDYPNWRSDVKSVERIPDQAAADIWQETDKHGNSVAYASRYVNDGVKLTREIVTKNLPYTGTWTFELQPLSSGSRLTITENGKVFNPIFRILGKYVFGFDTSIRRFLDDLSSRLR